MFVGTVFLVWNMLILSHPKGGDRYGWIGGRRGRMVIPGQEIQIYVRLTVERSPVAL